MHDTMESAAGIYRDKGSLSQAADKLHELAERVSRAAIDDHSLTFNTELVAAQELSFMLDVSQSIVQSALWRQESRGAHQRSDYPGRDDRRFLAHSMVHRGSDGHLSVNYLPVTITRWPPAKRVYGR
jgi:fumarate reductase flavoprotein subunit